MAPSECGFCGNEAGWLMCLSGSFLWVCGRLKSKLMFWCSSVTKQQSPTEVYREVIMKKTHVTNRLYQDGLSRIMEKKFVERPDFFRVLSRSLSLSLSLSLFLCISVILGVVVWRLRSEPVTVCRLTFQGMRSWTAIRLLSSIQNIMSD